MVRACNAEPGKLYKCSRTEPGPVIFYEFLTELQQLRLARRLQSRGRKLTTDEQAILLGARRGDRIAVRYVRGIASGQKYEHERYCAIPPGYELREIKRPPGFASKRPKDENEQATG